jgi:hypothetical protein
LSVEEVRRGLGEEVRSKVRSGSNGPERCSGEMIRSGGQVGRSREEVGRGGPEGGKQRRKERRSEEDMSSGEKTVRSFTGEDKRFKKRRGFLRFESRHLSKMQNG